MTQAELEGRMLAYFICHPHLVGEMGPGIPPEAFTDGSFRTLYSAMLSCFERDGDLDLPLVMAEAGAGKAIGEALEKVLDSAGQVASPGPALHYRKLLLQAHARRLVGSRAKAVEESDATNFDTAKEALLDALMFGDPARLEDRRTFPELVADVLTPEKAPLAVFTGLDNLDDLLGGIRAGEVVVVAARPSVGKSAFAAQVALNAARAGARVMFVSLEMTRDSLVRRAIANLARVDSAKLRSGTCSPAELDAAGEAGRTLVGLPLIIDAPPSASVALIRERVLRASRKGPPLGLVVVDYLQLLQGLPGWKSYERVSEASRAMKALAREAGVGILLLAQLNRESEKRPDSRPRLSDVRDSGQVEQDADVALLLSTEEPDEPGSPLLLDVAKNRDGARGLLHLTFDRPTSRILDDTPTWASHQA